MLFTYETKYNDGDKVYQIMQYINGVHILERTIVRAIGVVSFKEGSQIKYDLEPTSPSQRFFTTAVESALYATREEAEAVAQKKAADYIKNLREKYEQELAALETTKKMRIAEAIADVVEEFEEEASFIRSKLNGLK